MSTYAIGDLQGCFTEFEQLLDRINFDDGNDHLWLVGDLVNRGPNNAPVLDLIMSLSNVTCVLGNHDLHFLAVATGQKKQHRSDTLDDLLNNPRLPQYIDYLRHLPLLHYDADQQRALVHAGLPPQLGIEQCLALSREVETVLQSDEFPTFLSAMYGNEPPLWHDDLAGMDRLRVITNFLTRIRYCTAQGEMELTHKADIQPQGYAPWFTFNRNDQLQILFGHWAALNGITGVKFAIPLDTGCVWGRELTALRLEDETYFSVPATGASS
jgi:bis(5'-nucleosyl)-tetraphosphatase (symmetrical)